MTLATDPQLKIYTPAEYLALEETATERHEYRDGKIVQMTGATTDHNQICLNFVSVFKAALRGQGYRIFMTDVKVGIPDYAVYTYPDLLIVQGQPVYEGEKKLVVLNPYAIVEVLSKSTQSYDRGEKFFYYRSLPSLQEYLLIDQYSYHLEQYVRQGSDRWLLRLYDGAETKLELGSLPLAIEAADLYEDVEFPAEVE